MIRVDPSPIVFFFFLFARSWSESIRPGLAVRVDLVRLLYLPIFQRDNQLDLGYRCVSPMRTLPHLTVIDQKVLECLIPDSSLWLTE